MVLVISFNETFEVSILDEAIRELQDLLYHVKTLGSSLQADRGAVVNMVSQENVPLRIYSMDSKKMSKPELSRSGLKSKDHLAVNKVILSTHDVTALLARQICRVYACLRSVDVLPECPQEKVRRKREA